MHSIYKFAAVYLGWAALVSTTMAAPADYTLDPHHTFPSFEADHIGISFWRGKFNKSSGWVKLDKATGTGAIEVVVDIDSIDFGHDKLNEWARGTDFFDEKKFPKAVYHGNLQGVGITMPARVDGELTLRGVTRPVALEIRHFKCIEHPMLKKDYCGADAFAVFKRDEFGLDAGKPYGFSMDVTLRIQVEALKND